MGRAEHYINHYFLRTVLRRQRQEAGSGSAPDAQSALLLGSPQRGTHEGTGAGADSHPGIIISTKQTPA